MKSNPLRDALAICRDVANGMLPADLTDEWRQKAAVAAEYISRMDEQDSYVVACRGDDGEDIMLLTRQVFDDREAAMALVQTTARSRLPIVIAGRWRSLRFQSPGFPKPTA
jgi:hypothetical protein